MRKLLLLIEDDPAVQKCLAEALPKNLFILEKADNGREGLDLATQRKPDLILLDWNIPGMTGLELCRYLKQTKSTAHVPIIMLTGYSETHRKISAFNAGADDYITKPFEFDELVARIKAVLRRHHEVPEDILRAEGITLNLAGYCAEVGRKKLALTSTEFSLLHMLMKSPGRILTRKFLLERIWGYTLDVSTRTVDVYIRRLRKKLGTRSALNIQSVPGIGYKFKGVMKDSAPVPRLPWEAPTAVPATAKFNPEQLQTLV